MFKISARKDNKVKNLGYEHKRVCHSKEEYARDDEVDINTIE